jgi:hypothetical protein
VINDLNHIAYHECVNILAQHKSMTLRNLARTASENNPQIKEYLGDRYAVQKNRKLRSNTRTLQLLR